MTLADPLRVVLVGAGLMGRAWRDTIEAAPGVELVGIADLDPATAEATAAALGRPVATGTDGVALAAATGARAIVNATVPEAHHPVTTAALFAGLDVLGEKPVAPTVAEALSLAAATEVTGRLFMVSQSRRWNPQLFALRAMAEDLGTPGSLTTEFFREAHFPGFREEMAHPLLVDMAIHPFDSARFVLGAEPLSAYCESHNPPWSWFAGDAAATAVFEMTGGVRYTYTGSWVSPGTQTSWNGVWRLSGEKGSAHWDGDNAPVLDADADPAPRPAAPYSGIEGALLVFTDALRTGVPPMGEVHENVLSLAMVESAVRSADTGQRVLIDDVLAEAHAEALRAETHPDVRDALASWPSVRAVLTAARCRGLAAAPAGPAGPARTWTSAHNLDGVRLFVAIRPPFHVVEALGALPREPTRGVTWSVPEQWMVKLRPLGHVPDHVVDPLVTALADELDGVPPARCTLGPATRRLGGQWLGAPVSGLDDLATLVFDATVGLVPVTHPQPFQADVVLARGRVPAALAGEPVSAEWTAREVALVADRSSPRRPLLEDVASFPLTE